MLINREQNTKKPQRWLALGFLTLLRLIETLEQVNKNIICV